MKFHLQFALKFYCLSKKQFELIWFGKICTKFHHKFWTLSTFLNWLLFWLVSRMNQSKIRLIIIRGSNCTVFCLRISVRTNFCTVDRSTPLILIRENPYICSYEIRHTWWSNIRESPRGRHPCRFSSPRTYVELVSNTRRCLRWTPLFKKEY